MSVRATTYKDGRSKQSKSVKSDLSAKRLATMTGCNAVRVFEDGLPGRYFISSRSDGRHWHGPYAEQQFSDLYFGRYR